MEKNVWQPIETAPKDGTTVILYSKYSETGTGQFNRGKWFYTNDGCLAIERKDYNGTDYFEFYKPTHWMTLPQPPQDTSS